MGKNRSPTESEWLDLIAYHEAGHAVAALIGGLSVECVWIDRTSSDYDLVFQGCCHLNGIDFCMERPLAEAWIFSSFAGPIAERRRCREIRCRPVDIFDNPDCEAAYDMAMGWEDYSQIIDRAVARAKRVVRTVWPAIAAVGKCLVESRSTDGTRVAAVSSPAGSICTYRRPQQTLKLVDLYLSWMTE